MNFGLLWFLLFTCVGEVAARIFLCTAHTHTHRLLYKYISLNIFYMCALIILLSWWLQSFHQVYARAGRRQVQPLRTSTAVITLCFSFCSLSKCSFRPSTCVLPLQVGEVINTLCGYNTLSQQVRAAMHLLLSLPRCSLWAAAVRPPHYTSATVHSYFLTLRICQHLNLIAYFTHLENFKLKWS